MKIGGFQIKEPLPELHEPHALAILRPWIDVGGVGSMTLALIENHFHAQPFGHLIKPDKFLDFTRYRPVIHFVAGRRQVEIPNTFINYVKRSDGNDFIFFHLLEPHMLGEDYADYVLLVLQAFEVKRYCLIGSMYDVVPHTRPLIITGTAVGLVEGKLHQLGVEPSDYEGPTTIAFLVSQRAPKHDMEVMSLIVHLPQYSRLERDYVGTLRLMEVLCSLYRFSFSLEELRRKAAEQIEEMNQSVDREPELKQVVQQLEEYYNARAATIEEKRAKLSPEVEKFLRDVTRRFG